MEGEILQAIKEDRLYDYIANNYYKISQEKLKDIILELYYIYRCETIEDTEENAKQCNEHIAEYLIENRDWEE